MFGWEPPPSALPRTALRLFDGLAINWDRHIRRLEVAASELGWYVHWLNEVEPAMAGWISNAGTAALRLQLFPDALSARLEAIPVLVPSYRLIPMPHPLGDIRGNERAPFKGLLGLWDLQALDQARKRHAEDALFFWPDGTIAETAIASIGLRIVDHLFLPPLEGRVASITESVELPLWALGHTLQVQRRPITLNEVINGQLWCMNSLRGLWQAEIVQR